MAAKFNLAFLASAIYIASFSCPVSALGAQDDSWVQQFVSGSSSAEYSSLRDQDRDFNQLCQDVILPQWQPAPNIDSAIMQMESLMGQIKARFESQKDISRGYATYYYKTDKSVPESLSQPGAAFSYLIQDKPRSIPHPDLRESALYYKNIYNTDPTGIEIYTTSDGLTQVMLPIYSVKGLQKFWETEKLQNPPDFIPKIFQVAQIGFPQKWDYQSSERRDLFNYSYIYEFPASLDVHQELKKIGSITLHYDGKRTQSGILENITLQKISCKLLDGKNAAGTSIGNQKLRKPALSN